MRESFLLDRDPFLSLDFVPLLRVCGLFLGLHATQCQCWISGGDTAISGGDIGLLFVYSAGFKAYGHFSMNN